MAIRFYGDESEDKDSKVHGIGGFIGYADEWDDIQEKLIARVKPTGVSAYHMIDCECGTGEFSDWSKADRDQLTKDLIDIICDHNIYLIGMSVLLDEYNALPPVNDEGQRLGHDKWHTAFQAVIQEAATLVDGHEAPEETIAFFFDWKQKQGAANDLFEYTKSDDRLRHWRTRLGTLTFGHKEFDVPGSVPLLQIADIAAVETRKVVGNPITRPDLPKRKSLVRMIDANNVWKIGYYDGPTLRAIYEAKRKELGLA